MLRWLRMVRASIVADGVLFLFGVALFLSGMTHLADWRGLGRGFRRASIGWRRTCQASNYCAWCVTVKLLIPSFGM